MENPEVHHPHAHHGRGGLPKWLELTIAGTALVTSVCSIVIAIHHGHTMEKLVQANSIPYLVGGFSTGTNEGADVMSLDLSNRGVGPAHEKSLRVKVDGQYVKSVAEWINKSLPPDEAAAVTQARDERVLKVFKNNVLTRFIPGSQQQLVFRIDKTAENARLWDMLADAQPKWDIEYCYCSVFDDCWEVKGKWSEPTPVDECTRDEPHEFRP
ncbi:MAG TPA: hypothetical protein VJT80_11745 [Steroidobacteraceae bacterium]|jgi:hypothetical protein|nr:hypothetical protein [Steroidobacteraceae bacterium]